MPPPQKNHYSVEVSSLRECFLFFFFFFLDGCFWITFKLHLYQKFVYSSSIILTTWISHIQFFYYLNLVLKQNSHLNLVLKQNSQMNRHYNFSLAVFMYLPSAIIIFKFIKLALSKPYKCSEFRLNKIASMMCWTWAIVTFINIKNE